MEKKIEKRVENHWSFLCWYGGKPMTQDESDKEWMDMMKEAESSFVPVQQIYLKRIENRQYAMPSNNEILQDMKEVVQNNERLVTRLSIYFKDEETTRRFLSQIKSIPKESERMRLVKRYYDDNLCTGSKGMWEVLHDVGLYTKGYTNWNQQLNVR